jgi:RNA polymerase sigma factor (sigma-70 family)
MKNAPDLSSNEVDGLVHQAKRGSDRAFAELVKHYQSGLRNLLRRLSNNPELADDLAQKTFMEAWMGMNKLRSESAFGAWIRRIAINTWLKHCRSRDPLNAIDQHTISSIKTDRFFIDEKIDLDNALAALPKVVRLCIVLAYHQGMSHGMIADFTGMPLGTVKSHIKRGIHQLRQLLGAYEENISSGKS